MRFGLENQPNGTKRELTTPQNPPSNGMAERYNRTLCERVRCMLVHARLSKTFWLEALMTTAYVITKSPSIPLDGDIP